MFETKPLVTSSFFVASERNELSMNLPPRVTPARRGNSTRLLGATDFEKKIPPAAAPDRP